MKNKTLGGVIAAMVVMGVLVAVGFSPAGNYALAQITGSSAASASPGSTIVQQGTLSSNSTDLTILAPRSDGAVFTGTISYAAGASVQLYVLHAYSTVSGQTTNGNASAPSTTTGPDGKTYAISVLNNIGSSNGQSGSTVFSGNGLMLHSSGTGSYLATYTLKASVDTATSANSVAQTTVTPSPTATNQTVGNSTSSSSSTNTVSNTTSSSSPSITASAGSSNDTITVSGQGFPPRTQVTTIVTINGGTSGPTTSATADSSGAFTVQMPLTSTIHGSTIHIKSTSGAVSAVTTYTVP